MTWLFYIKLVKMKRRKKILLTTSVLMFCMFYGCAGKEETPSETVVEERSIEETNIEETECIEIASSEENNSIEVMNGAESKYPILLTPTLTSNIEFALKSEEIFCIYDGQKYGFMKQTGEEITDYIYDMAYPFSEGFACVMMNGKYGFIDTDGQEVIPFIYEDAAPFSEELAYFSIEEEYGFMTKDGDVAFYLDCDSVSSFQEGLAYFSIDGKYGYITKEGKIFIEPKYNDADYFKDGVAFVNKDGYKGAINSRGEEIIPVIYDDIYRSEERIIAITGDEKEAYNLSGVKTSQEDGKTQNSNRENTEQIEELESIYDYVGNFCNGRAEVYDGTNYGIVDENGNIVVPLGYENVRVFDDGSYFKKNGYTYLYNYEQELIYKSTTDDISLNGEFYVVEYNDKIVLLSKKGATILSVDYEYAFHHIYMDYKNYVLSNTTKQDHILILEENTNADLSEVLLKNAITPRIEIYWKTTHGKSVAIETDDKEVREVQQFDSWCEYNYIKKARLYDFGHSGTPLLYCYEKPTISFVCAMSDSALYSIKYNRLQILVTGNECGGTARGDYVCFWRNQENGEILIGYRGAAGGFGGYANYGAAYHYEAEEQQKVYSYHRIWQDIGNYKQEDLLEDAQLFYDDNDIPYTKNTIQDAESVNEYLLNDKRVTVEEYESTQKQYIYMELFQ